MLLAVALGAAAACGGQVSGNPDGGTTSSGSSGGSSSGSGGGSGGGSGPVPLCPVDPPNAGVSCASPGQGCAYLIGGQCEGYRCTSASGWKMDPTVTCP
jgi:hypothetical protein